MKYLLITHDFHPHGIGGMTHYYMGLAEAMGEQSLVVLTVSADGLASGDSAPGVVRAPVSAGRSGSFFGKRRLRDSAAEIVRREKIDAVLCGNFRPYGEIALDLKRRFGAPYYVVFHGNDLLRILDRMKRYAFKRRSYGRMLDAARGFVTNSRYVMDLIPAEYKKGKSLIVANPGIQRAFEGLPPAPPFATPGRTRLLTVGRLDRRKGVHNVLKALAILARDYPRLEYDVVGAGDTAFCRETARALGVEDRVVFHGFKPHDAVMEHFKRCDIFVMASYASDEEKEVEGFGIVYLEAGAFGKPVIGSRSGGIPEAVEDGVTGLLVNDPFDEREIAEKIAWMCDHADEAAAMGRAGRKRANDSFRYDSIAAELNRRIVEDLAERR